MSYRSRGRSNSWLDVVAGLLSKQHAAKPQRPVRRLAAERLERRMVLSVAPLADEASDGGMSLAEYMEQEREMGPVAPPAGGGAQGGAQDQATESLGGAIDAAPTDQIFSEYQGEGAGEGEGSGSGSGGGGASGSGSGGGAASGSGSGGGVGQGSGSGSGSGGGSASGSGGEEEAPVLSDPDVTQDGGTVRFTGTVSDDGGLGGMNIDLSGAEGTVTLDEYGNVTIEFPNLEGDGTITITITDGNGNSTQHSFNY